MKKVKGLILTVLIGGLLAGCGSKGAGAGDDTHIKLGVNGTDFRVWNYIEEELEKEGVELEVITFADYIQPNQALSEGEIDINSFQTQIYFDQFIGEHDLDLVSIGNTVFAPMGIYSEKITDIAEVSEEGKIGIPNDPTNGGRALLLLQDAGVIKLKKDCGLTPTVKDVEENPKNVEIIPMAAQQITLSLGDLEIGVINSGVAVTAGLSPSEDSIYIEDPAKEGKENYYNIFAVRKEDENNKTLKRVVEIYQTEPVKEILKEMYGDAQVPLF